MVANPAMSDAQWQDLATRTPTMEDFKLGPAPSPTPQDTYWEKWLKLVWMEEYCSMIQFKQEYRSLQSAHFNQDAFLSIKVHCFDEEEEAYRVTIQGTDPARDFALPDDMALPGDFSQGILKLPVGSGWVYVRKVYSDDPENNDKVQDSHDISTKKLLKSIQTRSVGGKQAKIDALAELYTEGFDAVLGSLPQAWRGYRRCVLFDSFSTCTRRFEALQKYPNMVHMELRRHIEALGSGSLGPVPVGVHKTAAGTQAATGAFEGQGPLLLPPPASKTPTLATKLNQVQYSILRELRAPLDFVQGPPGTGKSTFIVELLRTRIPKHRKVLLCTTTNKAIDSLAEKICATCGHDSVVAVGNPHRLGATSVTLTLDEKVKRHPSKEAWLDMCRKATYVLEAYYNIQQNALIEARAKDAEEARSNGSELLNGEGFIAHEAQVAASIALEMDAAKRAAEQATTAILGGLKKGRGRSKQQEAAASQMSGSESVMGSDDRSEDLQEAGDMRRLKELVGVSQGVLTQKVRPHVRSLRKMLQAVQDAAKKFVADSQHPEVLHGWIWSILPEMEWFLSLKLRVSVGLLEEFKLFSSNVLVINSATVDKLLRIHFLHSSLYLVCTAASAANLAGRVARDMGSIRKGLMESSLDSCSVLRLLACDCSSCKSCHLPIAADPQHCNRSSRVLGSTNSQRPSYECRQELKRSWDFVWGNHATVDDQDNQGVEQTNDIVAQLEGMNIGSSMNMTRGQGHTRPGMLTANTPSSSISSVQAPPQADAQVLGGAELSGNPTAANSLVDSADCDSRYRNGALVQQTAGSTGSCMQFCECSAVYRTFSCSTCRARVQQALENLPMLLEICELIDSPELDTHDLKEAVLVAEGGEEEGQLRERMLRQILCFGHVVLDEAGAMLEPDMVGTVLHGCRFLLCVGDHHQLPPFTQWKSAGDYAYNVSLLQRLAQRPDVAEDHNLMVVQYRMHPRIAKLVSDTFYSGRLTTAPAVAAARRRQTPVKFVDVDGRERRHGTSFLNMEEAHKAVDIVKQELMQSSSSAHAAMALCNGHTPPGVAVPGSGDSGMATGASCGNGLLDDLTEGKRNVPSIDVIAFHRPQVFAIRDALRRAGLWDVGNVDVTTVDSMQGREADVIILSCVRSGQKGTLGFLKNKNRLNVALSRAKQVMYIVGNMPALQRHQNPK